jgi:hypothetical protein
MEAAQDISTDLLTTSMYVFGEVNYFDGFMPDRVTQFLYMMPGGENWSWKGCLETCQDVNRST